MSTPSEKEEWSTLHDLALLYLFLAHGADAEIDPAERDTIVRRLGAWQEESDDDHILHTLDEVMLTYVGPHSQDLLNAAMVSLKDAMEPGLRVAILNDLADVASADGVLRPGEISFIQQLAYYWEVDQAARNHAGST